MELDENKLDEFALALLSLTLHDGNRAWKQINWEITDRLFEKGLICNPVGKSKSVIFTDKGLEAANATLSKHFAKPEIEQNGS